jgi:hypothetical protein
MNNKVLVLGDGLLDQKLLNRLVGIMYQEKGWIRHKDIDLSITYSEAMMLY